MSQPSSMMSKSSRSRLKVIRSGYCPCCGKEKLFSASLGEICLLKQRERMRARRRAKAGTPLNAPVRRTNNRTEDQRARSFVKLGIVANVVI